jgi:DNA repair photolyase
MTEPSEPVRSSPLRVLFEHPPARSALTATGGYLNAYTHTCNPVLGCIFGQSLCGHYCYAQHSQPAAMVRAQYGLEWGEYIAPKRGFVEALAADLRRASRRPPHHRHHVSRLRIFFASATEPCTGPALPITRACLQLLAQYPVARVVLQTRSPQVLQLRKELEALGDRVLLSMTLESDDDAAFENVGPPLLPRIEQRRHAFERLKGSRILRAACVSPCAHVSRPEEFARWIAEYADFAIVDTFCSGDGQNGHRTARTEIPDLFQQRGWLWSDESAARGLFQLLSGHMGTRVGWSREGFNRLATVDRADMMRSVPR